MQRKCAFTLGISVLLADAHKPVSTLSNGRLKGAHYNSESVRRHIDVRN